MIVKKLGTYVSLENLSISLREIHCSPWKLDFPLGTIMSLGERT
jgi:hypothetical protein